MRSRNLFVCNRQKKHVNLVQLPKRIHIKLSQLLYNNAESLTLFLT